MNSNLAKKLVQMADNDQKLLQQLFESSELPSETYHPDMQALHEKNAEVLKAIIAEHGWPGLSLAGQDGAEAAWLIVQHAVSDLDFMSECTGLLLKAVAKKDVEGWQLAFLQDRVNTMAGKLQVYGTQFDADEDGWPVSFPIAEPKTVNERRAKLGLNSLEDRLQEMRQRHANNKKV